MSHMASVDHIEGVYSLMPDEAAANSGTAGATRPRMKSSSVVDKLSANHEHSRRLTDIVKRKSRSSSTTSDTPLISQNKLVDGSESDDKATDHITMQMNEDVLISEVEEDDVLTPLSEPPSKQKGILKRSAVVDSGNFGGGVSSPMSINSSPPLSPSVSPSSRGGWRRESEVQFQLQPPSDATLVELQTISDEPGGNSEFERLDSLEEESQTIDHRLLSGNRIRSSLTKLTRYRSKGKGAPPPRKKLQRLQSQLDLDDLSRNEVELKANLYFHIGNPIKRWKVERVVPIKLLLQLLKTFCLIVQVILFTTTLSHQRSDFFYNSRVIFESLFIQRFQNGVTMPRDTYTAYNIQDMYSEFEYISRQYFNLRDITIGGYDYASVDNQGNPTPIIMELTQFTVAELNTVNNSYVLDGTLNKTVFYIGQNDNATLTYLEHSQDPLFHRFISLTVRMLVKNIRVVHAERAECFFINVSINYNNEDNGGKILYHLEEKHANLDCKSSILMGSDKIVVIYGAMTALDVMIIILCCFSIGLTIKSLERAKKLAKAMGTFYRRELGIKLSWWERRSLFPLWHALNITSDLLIIAGSFYKIFVDYRVNDLDDANPTSLLLGTAVLCQAGVILRYISYFKELNALTRTISLAFPELVKFLLCAGILFLAFTFNGWIILGPYHEKFVGFGGSFETLFSLLNGDDIYTTFNGIDMEDSVAVYVYSRLYMYVFLTLFLYFVLNLFTSLVISAYEASQSYNTAYDNEVRRFVFSGPLTPNGAALRDITRTKNYVDPEVIKKRMKQPPSESPQQKRRGYSWLQSAETVDQ